MYPNNQPGGLHYRVIRKRVKNINLHVDDGEVWVSAPRGVPQKTIDAFVQSKADWITRMQKRAQSSSEVTFFDGSSLLLLGERVPVCAGQGNKRKAELCDGVLYVTLPDPDATDALKNAVDKWLFSYSEALFCSMGEKLISAFTSYDIPAPTFCVRRFTARWGSCHTGKVVVTLSHRLACTPPECVQYVLAHELAHLVHPNHSAAFHALVLSVLPDHSARRALLKQYAGVLR